LKINQFEKSIKNNKSDAAKIKPTNGFGRPSAYSAPRKGRPPPRPRRWFDVFTVVVLKLDFLFLMLLFFAPRFFLQ
jgi:hypothetical protein